MPNDTMNSQLHALLFLSACFVLSACRPHCELIQVPAGQMDTLWYFTGSEDEVFTVIMPPDGTGFLNPEHANIVYAQTARRGVNDVYLRIRCRTDPGIGPYENNMHDYRGESRTWKLDDGSPYSGRFVKHICSRIGGWFGVFEYDALQEGDSIYRQDYFAIQEVPNRKLLVVIHGRFGTKAEQERLRQEAFQIIASLDWLTANKPMGCE